MVRWQLKRDRLFTRPTDQPRHATHASLTPVETWSPPRRETHARRWEPERAVFHYTIKQGFARMSDAEVHIHVLSARKAIFRFCRKISLGFWYRRYFWGRLFSSSTISRSFSNVGAGLCASPSGSPPCIRPASGVRPPVVGADPCVCPSGTPTRCDGML